MDIRELWQMGPNHICIYQTKEFGFYWVKDGGVGRWPNFNQENIVR